MESAEKTYTGYQGRGTRADLITEQAAGQCNQREMSKAEKIEELFTYHPPQSTEVSAKYETIRDAAKHLAQVIVKNTPNGSDQTAAIRLLREAVMTANASIALNGLNF